MSGTLRYQIVECLRESGRVMSVPAVARKVGIHQERCGNALRALKRLGHVDSPEHGFYKFRRRIAAEPVYIPSAPNPRGVDLSRYNRIALEEVWPAVVAVNR